MYHLHAKNQINHQKSYRFYLILLALSSILTLPPSLYLDFVLRALYKGNHINIAYCFLEDKHESTYIHAFRTIKAGAPLWDPTYFITDFELGEVNAIQAVHPNTTVYGCHFHYMTPKHYRESLANIPSTLIHCFDSCYRCYTLCHSYLCLTSCLAGKLSRLLSKGPTHLQQQQF